MASTTYLGAGGAKVFDIASLYQLRAQIEESLKVIESQISDFIDDESTAPQLADAIEMMEQNRSVLDLIELVGTHELTDAIIDALQYFLKTANNNHDELIFALSEGVMMLGRYIEFVLLRERLQPRLLLKHINNIRQHLDQQLLGEGYFEHALSHSSDSKDNFKSTKALGKPALYLQKVYRTGLVTLLKARGRTLNEEQLKRTNMMFEATRFANERLGSSFWEAAMLATQNIQTKLPLSHARKRALIYIDQQLNPQTQAVDEAQMKDVLVMAVSQSGEKADQLARNFELSLVGDEEFSQMSRFMNGPVRSVVDAVDQLIQEEINSIKDRIDGLAKDDVFELEKYREIAIDMRDLALRLFMLGLKSAAQKIMQEAKVITSWKQKPQASQYDQLLRALLYAENASTLMARSHTPGAVSLPLNNKSISLHHLDTAFAELISEARATLANATNSILAYSSAKEKDKLHLSNLPEMLHSVGGAMLFVDVIHGYKLLNRTAKYIVAMLKAYDEIPRPVLERLADIVSGADYYLESVEQGRPSGEQPLVLGAQSLKQLLAAA